MLKKFSKTGSHVLSLLLSGLIISVTCAILIILVHTRYANNGVKLHIAGSFLVMVIFFIPVIVSSYITRNKVLVLQCMLCLVIAGFEIGLFLSTLYMAKPDALFAVKLFIIALGAIFFPVLYNHFIKKRIIHY